MNPIGRILCAVDFSPESKGAVDYAASLSRTLAVPVVLLHSHYEPAMAAYGRAAAPEWQVWMPAETEERAELERWVEGMRVGGTEVTSMFLEGSPTSAIARNSEPGDLLVVGTHARAGLERSLLGSAAERIIRHANCPTIVVPPDSRRRAIAAMLVAIDFSAASLHALRFSAAFAERLGATVRALHVVHSERLPYESHFIVPEYLGGMIDAATVNLKAATEKFPGMRTMVRAGIPYAEILEEAEAADVDLIAVGVHGHNPLEAAMLGSTANHVIRRAHRPVLVAR